MAKKAQIAERAVLVSDGGLPKGWRMARFDEIGQMINERVDPSETDADIYVGLEHLDSDTLKIRRWGSPSDVIGDKLQFQKGDIIFGRRRAYQRKLAVAEFDGICSAHAMVVRAKTDAVHADFLPFLMQSNLFMQRAIEISVGSLSPTINWKTLRVQEFPLPPKDEQRRIADILWAADVAIEQHKAAAHKTSELLEVLRRDVFHEHLKKGATSLLSDVGEWRSGGTPPRNNADFWGGDFPWVSPKDMKVMEIHHSEEHLTPEGKSEAIVVPCNSILLVIRGMILAHTFPVAITKREVAFNQDMKAIITSDTFDPLYVYHWLQSQSMTILGMVADSSHGTKRLPMEPILSLRIPSTNRKTQGEAVQLFQQVGSTQLRLMAHTESLRQLKFQLMQNLLVPGEAP